MRYFFRISVVFLFAVLANEGIHAQFIDDTIQIAEIKIHSARRLQDNSLTLTRLDSVVLHDKANSSLSEVLSEHSNIFIKSYGRGAMASASFRGTDPSHTKVLWNGIELNSPMLGMVDFSIIPMFFIDNVELLHGTSSISETSGAMGGLINLSTEPDWKSRISGSYMQGAGSFGSHNEHVRINLGNQKIQSQTRFFYASSRNDFKFENHDIIDSVDLETGKKFHPVMKNEDAWFRYYGVLQEVHYRPGKNDFLSMSFWGQQSSRSIPLLSTSESGPNNNINRQNDNSLRGQVTFRHFGTKYNLKIFSGLNYMDLDYSLKNRLSGEIYIPAIDSKSKTSSLFNKIDLQYAFSPELRMEFTAGADLHQVESLEKIKALGYDKSRMQTHFSGSVYKKWSKRWTSSLKAGGESVSGQSISPVLHTGTEFHILPDDRLFLKFIVAANTRYPSLNDQYYQPGGNIGLKPETSHDQEFGVHYGFENSGVSFSQDASFYMSQVKDWIMWYYTVRGFSPENIDKVDIKGFETNLNFGFTGENSAYKLITSYSLSRSRDMGKAMNGFDLSYGKQLPYIPVHSANVMVYLMKNNWSVTYIWNYYSKRYTTTSNVENNLRDSLYPYFMNQLGLGKQIQAGRLRFDMIFRIHNLFDEQYRSILQRPMPGRNYSIQVKIDF